MPLDQRVCPPCGTEFTPRRVDQIFHLRECRDKLYDDEYLSLFYQFAVVLNEQGYVCYFCKISAVDRPMRPLYLSPADRTYLVAACQPCKNNYYITKFVVTKKLMIAG